MSDNPYESPDSFGTPPHEGRTWTRMFIKWSVALGVILIVIALLLPANRGSREAARRSQCRNNLRQIGLALQNYHDVYKFLPPAYTVDAEGKRLHSWRTLILPYIEQTPLYDKIDISKPWDHPVNKKAFAAKITMYRCPSTIVPPGHTTYLAVVAPNSCFPGSQAVKFSQVTDGTSNTLAVVEVDSTRAVHWMSPNDVDEAWLLNIANIKKLSHSSIVQAAMLDTSVRPLSQQTKPETLGALITISGDDNQALEGL